jgi:solute carrier family 30 (zinc transporter), member 1
VDNVHELHIWQLSDVKMIASVHIQVNLPPTDRTKRYHAIARAIRTCLHAYGIHSSTIQPEFADDLPVSTYVPSDGEEDTPLIQEGRKGCLFECVGGGDCEGGRCCDTTTKNGDGKTGTYGTGS